MHILLTVLHTFLEVMIGGIVFNNQQRLQLVIISFIFMSSYFMTRGSYCKEKLDASHSLRSKD